MPDPRDFEKNDASGQMQKVVLAAELYYIYHLTQEQIAKRIGVSRPWVSKLLQRAEDAGIVRIDVSTFSSGITDVEEQLKERFNIRSAKVIKPMPDGQTLPQCALAAAHYVISILESDSCISLAWGKTLAAMVDAFIPMNMPNVMVVPLVGGLGANPTVLSNQLAANLAQSMGAKCSLLHVPAFVGGKEEKQLLMNNPIIHKTIELSEHADIAIFGIGALHYSTIVREGYISRDIIAELENAGAVGDIALHFIDMQGRLIEHPISDQIVSGDIKKTRSNAKHTIGIAIGDAKVPVILAALNGRWLDALITDLPTANLLLGDG
jgi:DNA-binding transcriptional regulator LsrR (DeoR family)